MARIFSCFDGMSCAQIALERLGVDVEFYVASETDKYAIKVTQANYPDTIQMDDIRSITRGMLPPDIDLMVGGSPCQGFSFAGKGKAFSDERSSLFFEFARLVCEVNPRWFLLENVRMKKEHQDVISACLGVEPICINSALLSAQNRVRYYWTNIPGIEQPIHTEVYLKDIVLDADLIPCIKVNGELRLKDGKSQCLDANYHKGVDNHGQRTVLVRGGAIRGRHLDQDGKRDDRPEIPITQQLEVREDGKSNALTTVQKDTLVCVRAGTAVDIKGHDYNKRVYSIEGKSPALAAASGGNLEPKIALDEWTWRKLHPVECERLQTVPDNYTNHVSNTQRYKMLGGGFTVDAIAHILKGANL